MDFVVMTIEPFLRDDHGLCGHLIFRDPVVQLQRRGGPARPSPSAERPERARPHENGGNLHDYRPSLRSAVTRRELEFRAARSFGVS